MKTPHWKGFASLLCPVDFSDTSALALRHAALIAGRFDATLTVAYANDPLLVTAASLATHSRKIVQRSARELREFIESILPAETCRRLRLRSRVTVGPASQEILRAATTRFDLIVMGTQGLAGVNRLFLGSTTLEVLRKSSLPVLAVPRHFEGPPLNLRSWPGARILAAIEYGPHSRGEVENAARVAQSFGASLLLVHVIGELQVPPWLRPDIVDHERRRFARAEQWLGRMAAYARRHVAVEARVVSGPTAEEIVTLGSASRARLLITSLGERQRWWSGSPRGSVSYRILTESSMSVLACPRRWRAQ